MSGKVFFLCIAAGIFSSVACIVYDRAYYFALETDFSKLVNIGSMVGLNLIACLLAGAGYAVIKKWAGRRSEPLFNLAFTLLSFLSIAVPFAVNIPVDIKHPEYFYGLVVPMHFFPALSWLTLKPFFIRE